MTAEEFVKKITDIKPTSDEVSGLDYPDGLLDDWLNEFDVQSIMHQTLYDDQITSLIKNYDVSSLVINDVKFDPDMEEDDEFLFFGWDINDRLAVYKPSGKIVSYDVYSGSMVNCADDSAKFLAALFEIMKFVKEKILNNYDEAQRDERSYQVAYIAALKAGGEEYEGYYKSVLWVE